MSDFVTPEEDAVMAFVEEAIKSSVDFFESDDYTFDWDDSGIIEVVETKEDGYGGLVTNNTYSIEIKVKKND